MSVVTRFAPSPTGGLHLGHAYSALDAFDAARTAGGRFLLRIEDIDQGRCRPEFEQGIYDDLMWLGLSWETPVRRQSDHFDDYKGALDRLSEMHLIYPCFCTRKDIAAEIEAAGGAPQGPDGPVYPGTCRHLSETERYERIDAGESYALRLNMTEAAAHTGQLTWRDLNEGEITARPERFGDVVLARKDTPTSYHLAVTFDDDLQGVTLVTRGVDLFDATDVHRLLQALLGLDTPDYRHHKLLTGTDGKRLAKRDKAATLADLRASGKTPDDVRDLIGWVRHA
jgi:glutamyl-Q tRNA(Asp) synthetase